MIILLILFLFTDISNLRVFSPKPIWVLRTVKYPGKFVWPIAQLWYTRREGSIALYTRNGCGSNRSPIERLEYRDIHRITDSDPTVHPLGVGHTGNPAASTPPSGFMVEWPASYDGRRNLVLVWAVPLDRAPGQHGGVEGKGIHQTLPPWEAPGHSLLDHRKRVGRHASDQIHLFQDRGDRFWVPLVKASKCVLGERCQLQRLHRRAFSNGASGYHGGHSDRGGPLDIRKGRVRGGQKRSA